nr:ERI1 exoribonuclease 3-like [Setaria viridis]
MASASQQQIFRKQEFDYFVMVDFEATCEKDVRVYPQEIIEFPAVLVDAATGDLVFSFRTYVKPRHHPRLTAFCSELTGIQQEQVDGGVDLDQALTMHDAWLTVTGVAKNRLAVVTWGDWD